MTDITSASETNSSLSVKPKRTYAIGIASETNQAIPLGIYETIVGDVIVYKTLAGNVEA